MGYLLGLGTCPIAHGDHDGHCSWCGRPLAGRRTRWCSDECRAGFALHHYWTLARAEALRRARNRCRLCSVRAGLEVHHLDPVGDDGYGPGCAHHQSNLVVLCHDHHLVAESARRRRATLAA